MNKHFIPELRLALQDHRKNGSKLHPDVVERRLLLKEAQGRELENEYLWHCALSNAYAQGAEWGG